MKFINKANTHNDYLINKFNITPNINFDSEYLNFQQKLRISPIDNSSLIFNFDLANNTGNNTFDPNATTIKDLKNSYNINLSGTTYEYDELCGLKVKGGYSPMIPTYIEPALTTTTGEFCFKIDDNPWLNPGSYQYLWCNIESGGECIYHYRNSITNQLVIGYYPYVNGAYRNLNYYLNYYNAINKRFHVVTTRDGSVMKLYINGVLVNSIAQTGTGKKPGSTLFQIGRNPAGSTRGNTTSHFTMYCFRFYTTALTAEEIYNNYLCAKIKYNIY